jgi:hypothetical protein
MPKLEKILAFFLKCAKLVLLLIMIMDCVHEGKIIHNVISPSNFLLCFLPNHVDRVYIGKCNWGLAICIIEDTPLMYGFSTTTKIE